LTKEQEHFRISTKDKKHFYPRLFEDYIGGTPENLWFTYENKDCAYVKRKKNSKTLDDVSVSRLLDEFVDLNVVDDPKRVTGMTEEEYVQLMLKKEAKRKMARARREPRETKEEKGEERGLVFEGPPEKCQTCFYCTRVLKVGESFLCSCTNNERKLESRYFEYKWWVICQDNPPCWKSPPMGSADAILHRKFEAPSESEQEAEKTEVMVEKRSPTHRPPEIVTELDPETEKALAFLRDEVISVSSKRKALETIEKYRKEPPAKQEKKKKRASVVSEKISPVNTCQNCYYCAAQRTVGGSVWCHCSNPGRSIDATSTGKSWVKNTINLPCWKAVKE
jgi:hypothetical protein